MASQKASIKAKKKKKVKKERTPQQIKRRSILFTAFWCLVIIGAIVGLSVVGYVVHDVVSVVNGDKVIDLNVYKENQDQTTIIYAYDEDEKLVELKKLHGTENRIWVDIDSKTSMEHLYAIGETSCNGVHGANRLASNSLLESLVFAEAAAKQIVVTWEDIDYDKEIDLKKYDDLDKLEEEYKTMVLEEMERMDQKNV